MTQLSSSAVSQCGEWTGSWPCKSDRDIFQVLGLPLTTRKMQISLLTHKPQFTYLQSEKARAYLVG